MAYEAAQIKFGNLTAAADLSAKQYHFVKLTSSGVNVCSAITDVAIGVLQNTPSSGQPAEICIFGVTKVKADGTLAVGDRLGTSTDSQADAIAAGTAITVTVLGQAITAASAGEISTMFLNPSGARAA